MKDLPDHSADSGRKLLMRLGMQLAPHFASAVALTATIIGWTVSRLDPRACVPRAHTKSTTGRS